ncbi:hypothetical protein ABZT47_06195 [Sphaerisporangium sp. NPDC005289]|uniref:hypothetical protein n=1 Tax=Sphaerisporangium sp. NPDC005289 TaxID=3155247 RepID=UPI0033BAD370
MAALLCYLAAVGVLTWVTMEGLLGDSAYGFVLMLLMAFPVSIATLLVEIALTPIVEAQSYEVRQVVYYLELALPGVMLAVILLMLLKSVRSRAVGRGLAWFAAACVLVSGVLIVLDDWEPRRLYGWPLLVCGLGMAAGLIAGRRVALPRGTEKE